MRVINFPPNYPVGKILIEKKRGTIPWDGAVPARGKIEVPNGMRATLWVAYHLPGSFNFCKSLQPNDLDGFIYVSTNKFDGTEISKILHLTGLRSLQLWETNITDSTLEQISVLKNLESLDIGDTLVSDEGLSYLKKLDRLKSLSLLNNSITSRGVVHLSGLNLTNVDLMNTEIADDCIESLEKIKTLKYLRIFDTKISKQGFNKLKSLLPDTKIRYYESNDLQ